MKRFLTLLAFLLSLYSISLNADEKKTTSKEEVNKTLILIKTQHNRPLSPSNQTVEVYQTGDILTFGITEEMGACIIFIGERENPVETYMISCDDPCVSVSGIETGEYPLILVTEGYQIFQGTIEL